MNSKATFLREWGTRGSNPGEFQFPIDIVISETDEIFVGDFSNARIQVFGMDGQLLAVLNVAPNPGGLALDAEGNLYISHFSAMLQGEEKKPDRITVWTQHGEYLREWGGTGTEAGDFDCPGGIAISPDGRVYVADQTNHRIQVFNQTGTFLDQWGEYGVEPGQFGGNTDPLSRLGGPQFVAIDSGGNIYTTEGSVGRVQKFTASGEFLTAWGDNGMAEGGFGGGWEPGISAGVQGPICICLDSRDRVWVSSVGGRIQQFSSEGKFLGGFGNVKGAGPGEFIAPHGLATDSHGHLYVVDSYNHRVQKFEITA